MEIKHALLQYEVIHDRQCKYFLSLAIVINKNNLQRIVLIAA